MSCHIAISPMSGPNSAPYARVTSLESSVLLSCSGSVTVRRPVEAPVRVTVARYRSSSTDSQSTSVAASLIQIYLSLWVLSQCRRYCDSLQVDGTISKQDYEMTYRVHCTRISTRSLTENVKGSILKKDSV